LSLQDWRDIIVIAAGSMMVLVLLVVFLFTVVLGLATRSLLKTVQTLLRGEIAPLLDSVRQSVQNVRGTTAFIGETAVSPIIRVCGAFAGARRMMGVLGGFAGRRGRRK
jgi:hypothetical protein